MIIKFFIKIVFLNVDSFKQQSKLLMGNDNTCLFALNNNVDTELYTI